MTYKIPKKKLKEKNFEVRSYKVYKFENAPKEVQEKALEKYRYFNVEDRNMLEQDDFLIDLSLKKDTLEQVEKTQGTGNTLFTWKSGNYNVDYGYQYVQFKELEVKDDEAFRKELGISKKLWEKVDYSFENPSREGNTQIAFTLKDGGDTYELPKEEQEELDKGIDHFSYLMRESTKNLQKYYEYDISDEAVKEGLIDNEYYFNDKGEID